MPLFTLRPTPPYPTLLYTSLFISRLNYCTIPSLSLLYRLGGVAWRSREGDSDDEDVVSAGSSVTVTQTFVVTDTGMTVRAGTVCDVMRGNNDAAGNIYVRFSHPQPPWVVLVSRLYAMSADLQVYTACFCSPFTTWSCFCFFVCAAVHVHAMWWFFVLFKLCGGGGVYDRWKTWACTMLMLAVVGIWCE